MDTRKVAVIGAGRWGKNIIRTLTQDCPSATLAQIVYSGSKATAEFLAAECPNIPHTTELSTLLTDSAITHVFIATPIPSHFELAKQCLAAGKHTFVEKPLTLTETEVNELHTLAESHKLQLVSGYVFLFDESLIKLAEILTSKHNIALQMNWEKWGSFDSALTENLLVHELAIAHVLLGDLERLGDIELCEHQCTITVAYEHGQATIKIDREQQKKRKWLTATVDDDQYELESGTLTYTNAADGTSTLHSSDVTTLLKNECEAFLSDKQTFDWQNIDREVATILEQLNARP